MSREYNYRLLPYVYQHILYTFIDIMEKRNYLNEDYIKFIIKKISDLFLELYYNYEIDLDEENDPNLGYYINKFKYEIHLYQDLCKDQILKIIQKLPFKNFKISKLEIYTVKVKKHKKLSKTKDIISTQLSNKQFNNVNNDLDLNTNCNIINNNNNNININNNNISLINPFSFDNSNINNNNNTNNIINTNTNNLNNNFNSNNNLQNTNNTTINNNNNNTIDNNNLDDNINDNNNIYTRKFVFLFKINDETILNNFINKYEKNKIVKELLITKEKDNNNNFIYWIYIKIKLKRKYEFIDFNQYEYNDNILNRNQKKLFIKNKGNIILNINNN